MRSSSEPLPHLDKPILRVKMHQYFDNITKEFDIALIKFDDSGILFEVTHLKIYLLKPDLSPTSSPFACLRLTWPTWLGAEPGSLAGASRTWPGSSCQTR